MVIGVSAEDCGFQGQGNEAAVSSVSQTVRAAPEV